MFAELFMFKDVLFGHGDQLTHLLSTDVDPLSLPKIQKLALRIHITFCIYTSLRDLPTHLFIWLSTTSSHENLNIEKSEKLTK